MRYQQFLHRTHKNLLHVRSDSRNRAGFITALTIGDFCADVTWAIVSVGRHRDKIIGPHLLSGKLVFDKQFPRHVQNSCRAQLQAGDRDPMTPDGLSTYMVETIPDAELMLVRGGTHYVPVEFPNDINQRIQAFLGEKLRAAA